MRSRLALGIAATAALLVGCNQPGTVATVNGDRISQREFSQAAELVRELEPAGMSSDQRVSMNTLSGLLLEPFMTSTASEYGITLSDQETVEILGAQMMNAGNEAWEAADYSAEQLDLGRSIAMSVAINSHPDGQMIIEDVLSSFFAADLEINPRYGQLTEDGRLAPASFEWIYGTETAG